MGGKSTREEKDTRAGHRRGKGKDPQRAGQGRPRTTPLLPIIRTDYTLWAPVFVPGAPDFPDFDHFPREKPSAFSRKLWALHRFTVARQTREFILDTFPAARRDQSLRYFLQYILFSRWAITGDGYWQAGGLPLPSELLAEAEGKWKDWKSKHYVAGHFLQRAKEELRLTDFDWTRGGVKGKRYREVRTLTIPSDVVSRVRDDLRKPITALSDRVYFVSGEKMNKGARSAHTASRLAEAELISKELLDWKGRPQIPTRILHYLNGLPSKAFTQTVRSNCAAAHRTADEILKANERSGLYALTLLRLIEAQPKPVYQARTKTERLFAPDSLQLVNREVRDALVPDWVDLDLSHAHVSICAKLWGCTKIQSFLSGGGAFWPELLAHAKLEKKIAKPLLYAVTFGAGIRRRKAHLPSRLDRMLMDTGLDLDQAGKARKRLMSHPFMRELEKARNKRVKEIENAGHIVDVFGVRLDLDAENDADARSLMACEVQAIELQLLWPAFELAEQNGNYFKIMLYTFDGLHVSVHDRKRTNGWVAKIQAAVDTHARKLGYQTSLVRD